MAPAEPLTLAWTAVNRTTSQGTRMSQEERIPVYEALKAITIDAARALNLETEIGSLEPGKVANFTILGANPLEVDAIAGDGDLLAYVAGGADGLLIVDVERAADPPADHGARGGGHRRRGGRRGGHAPSGRPGHLRLDDLLRGLPLLPRRRDQPL